MIPNIPTTEDRAVSPVVGVALLIAITVILAAVIGAVVLGLGVTSADAPQASLQFEYDDGELTIHHAGGETLSQDEIVLGGDADHIDDPLDDDLSSGNSEEVNVTLEDGDTVTVVWEDPNSDDSSVISSFDYSE